MTCRQWAWCGLCAVVVVAVALLAGCPSREPEQAAVSEPPPGPVAEPPAPAEPAEAPATAVAEFEYTETPSAEAIPAGPVTGIMHQQAFAARTIRIEKKDEDTFQMQITDGELADPNKITGTITGDDGWRFRFTLDEGATTTLERAIDDKKTFDDEHVYYYYQQGEGKPPMSVNGPWGAALVITEWTRQEPAEGSRVIGLVKGRVALVMRDADKSWVAGEFEAPVFEW